jgi:hypothetical protein
MHDTELETTRRKVAEDDQAIVCQRALIRRLHASGNVALAMEAEETLGKIIEAQQKHFGHLQGLMENRTRRPDTRRRLSAS